MGNAAGSKEICGAPKVRLRKVASMLCSSVSDTVPLNGGIRRKSLSPLTY